MTRSLTLVAALALAVAPAAAEAKKGHSKHTHKPPAKAKVLRATLKPTAADVAAYTDFRGKAQMVANKRNAKVSIQLKGMVGGTTYAWAVVTGSCDGDAVTGLRYKTLRARPSGVATAKGESKKEGFRFDAAVKHFVVVSSNDQPLLCGQLKGKAKKRKGSKGGSKHHKTSKGQAKGKGGR